MKQRKFIVPRYINQIKDRMVNDEGLACCARHGEAVFPTREAAVAYLTGRARTDVENAERTLLSYKVRLKNVLKKWGPE